MNGTAVKGRTNVFASRSGLLATSVTFIVSSTSVMTVNPTSGTSSAAPRDATGVFAVASDWKEIERSFHQLRHFIAGERNQNGEVPAQVGGRQHQHARTNLYRHRLDGITVGPETSRPVSKSWISPIGVGLDVQRKVVDQPLSFWLSGLSEIRPCIAITPLPPSVTVAIDGAKVTC